MHDTGGMAASMLGDRGFLEPVRRSITKYFKGPRVCYFKAPILSTGRLINNCAIETLREPTSMNTEVFIIIVTGLSANKCSPKHLIWHF